jgi:hypothetical protein
VAGLYDFSNFLRCDWLLCLSSYEFLIEKNNALDVLLKDIGLSEEKFKRIISLLRKIGRISGSFDNEWGLPKIRKEISRDSNFAKMISELFVNGKHDKELSKYIPRYYLDMLNYREISGLSRARHVRYKDALIGTYGGRKGHRVEDRIREKLEEIQIKHGVGYEKGRSPFLDTDVDFALPSLQDHWVIIMSSFQETTASGQTNKTRDMLAAYERINRINSRSRHRENRVFVNFVDGGGWLARKRDFQRLVEQCHYFINLQHLDMLEAIILEHVPKSYFGPQ